VLLEVVLAQLDDQEGELGLLDHVVELDDVLRGELLHDGDLLLEGVEHLRVAEVLHIHDLDCDRLLRPRVHSCVDLTVGALTQVVLPGPLVVLADYAGFGLIRSAAEATAQGVDERLAHWIYGY